MSIYNVINWCTGAIEAYYIYMLFECFLIRREQIHRSIYYIYVPVAAAIFNVCNLYFYGVYNLVGMTIVGILFSVLYKGRQIYHLVAPALWIMVITVTEISVLFVMSILTDENVNIITENGYLRIAGIVFSKIFGYIIISLVTKRVRRDLKCIDLNYWLLFVVIFFSSTVTICTFCKIMEDGVGEYAQNMILASTLGTSATAFIILFLHDRTLKQQYALNAQQLRQAELGQQISHYKALMMSQNEICRTRHDLKNHLLAIQSYLKTGDTASADEYIENLLGNIKNKDSDKTYFDTGNTVLDAMITSKKREAERKNIKFSAKLVIPYELPIEDSDICVILGNALDNAIEACEKVKNESYILTEIAYGDNSLIIRIENSCTDNGGERAVTTKADKHNHGIGRESIRQAVQKYNGEITTSQTDNKYTLTIIFIGNL